jgi:hypothetical protein
MNFGNYGNNFQNNAMNMSNNLTPQNQININQNNMNMTDSSNFVPPLYQMNQMNLMNQNTMNMNKNSLYMMNFQQTFQNMQPSVKLLDINFNNMTNILSLLNLPIIVPCHSQHPLINCRTVGRIAPGTYWKCNCCGTDYSYNVPTFYCTACDYDLCQKCLLCFFACQIVIYNYTIGNIQSTQQCTNIQFLNQKIHQHPIMRILREPTYFENKLSCNFCGKYIQMPEQFYYCSLCNYCICLNCYQQRNQFN